MYFATIFYLLVMDFLIPLNPASLMASFRGGYTQRPYPLLRGCLPVICRTAPCWKLSRSRSILGVSTHVSAPNRNNTYTTSLKKFPNTLASAPSRHSIRDKCPQLFRAFYRLPATAGQLLYPVVITVPGT